ncbi:S9 family peptidase [bacterium]|nr:S9 family peptidase [bacterium]
MAKSRRIKALTFDDLIGIDRIGAPAISPDGRHVAYTVTTLDAKTNKSKSKIHLLDVKSRRSRLLTPGPGSHSAPAWSPDGTKLAFASDRDDTGCQLWVLPTKGGEARRVTSGYGGVSTPVWFPDNRRVAFVRSAIVSPDYDPKKDKKREENKSPASAKVFGLPNEKSSARIYDGLLFRHWDHFSERTRQHVFVVDTRTEKSHDLFDGEDIDAPPTAVCTDRDFDISPDGKTLAFSMNPDRVVARTTNNSIFLLPLENGKRKGDMTCVSVSAAADVHPRFARDGRLYYMGMEVPGYEADRARIRVYDPRTGQTQTLAEKFDRAPCAFLVTYDEDGEESIVFLACDRGYMTIYRMDPATETITQLTLDTYNTFVRAFPNTDMLFAARETSTSPADFYAIGPGAGIKPFLKSAPAPENLPRDAGASAVRLTRYADAVKNVEMNDAEPFWYAGAGGTPVHGFLIRPPRFSARRKYPLILLIHGGPQSAFCDNWHYRWNAQMFASTGAVVAFVNPRGSTGYGQKFTDQISGDWGGRCYDDIMKGVDHILATYDFIDKKRLGAAGASFGGYMVNWILGHSDRFQALVSHDGVFFAETMAYTTDELWFDEHEHGGLPHEKRAAFVKNSPHMHVANFKTPTLVIHGEKDYRCPTSEGFGLFTALQTMDVPSRLLYFPDEGHWVMQPANAQVWYAEVLGWLKRWLALKD